MSERIKIIKQKYDETTEQFEQRVNDYLVSGMTIKAILEDYEQDEYHQGYTNPLFILSFHKEPTIADKNTGENTHV